MYRIAIGILLFVLACGVGKHSGAVFSGEEPADCRNDVLTIQIENRTTSPLNIYWLRNPGTALRIREGTRIASNITEVDVTRFTCRERWIGERVVIGVDPVGKNPYVIDERDVVTQSSGMLEIVIRRSRGFSTYYLR